MTPGPVPDLDVAFVLIGGYTAEMEGGAALGITVLAPDPNGHSEDGDDEGARDGVTFSQTGSVAITSPSYLIAHRTEPWIFAASESGPASVSSLRLGADGSLSELSTVRTGGDYACHLALSPNGRQLVAANYGSGSVSSFLIGPNGLLTECRDLVAFGGSGPHQERQDAPHAHQALWDSNEILVCDLGTDLIHRLSLDEHGRFAAGEPVRLPPGSGPRHCVIVDDHLVVACELSAELWVARRSATGWEETQRVPTSTSASVGKVGPAPVWTSERARQAFRRANERGRRELSGPTERERTSRSEPQALPSAIVADGPRIFVANRGPGTVGAFDVLGGLLTPVSEFACGGSWPRDLTIAAGRLWVANQTEDVVTVLSLAEVPPSTIDFEIATPTPTCVLVVPRVLEEPAR
jgi:6-phosphogluconolactonase